MTIRWGLAAAVLSLAACGGIGPNPSKPGGVDGPGVPAQPAPPTQPAPPPSPLIAAQSFAATEDADFSATVATLAGANATLSVTASPSRGTLTAFDANGAFSYRPAADFHGADSFTVEAVDAANTRASAVITVNVAPVNDAPVAAGEILEVASAAEAVLPVLDNDTDVDDSALALVLAAGANPDVGVAAIGDGNRIRLTLPEDFRGTTRVRYRVRDAAGAESAEVTAVVYVATAPQNLWYVAPGSGSTADLFVTDLLETRQVTQFAAPRGAGNVIVSADRRTLLVPEREEGNVRVLWAIDTGSRSAPVRVSPDHGPGRAIGRYVLSPDGEWAAWLVGDAAQVPELWFSRTRATPDPRRVTLPSGTLNLETIHLMRFSPDSGALYFGSTSAGGNTALLRMEVASAAAPAVVYPRAGETGGVVSFFMAPDDSYVVVLGRHLFRVPIGSAAPSVRLNPALAPGQSVVAPSTNRDVTRFVYRTTDGRLWSSSLAAPGVSELLLDRDASRGIPVIDGVRPDGGAVLVRIPSSAIAGQVDLAEILLPPAGAPAVLQAPAEGFATVNQGQYLNGDSVLSLQRADARPTRLFEFRRGVSAPVAIGEPGVSSAGFRSSADLTLVAYMQDRGDGHQGVIVSRSSPAAVFPATPVIPRASGYDVVTLTARPR